MNSMENKTVVAAQVICSDGDYYIDASGNRWSVAKFTFEEARAASLESAGCVRCTDCVGCRGCADCTGCTR